MGMGVMITNIYLGLDEKTCVNQRRKGVWGWSRILECSIVPCWQSGNGGCWVRKRGNGKRFSIQVLFWCSKKSGQ